MTHSEPPSARAPVEAGLAVAGIDGLDLLSTGHRLARQNLPLQIRDDAAGEFALGACLAASRVRGDSDGTAAGVYLFRYGAGFLRRFVRAEARHRHRSLDAPLAAVTEDGAPTLLEVLYDADADRPDARAAGHDLAAVAAQLLRELKPRERRAVRRVVLEDATFADVGKELNRSTEGVRQTVAAALRRMRRRLVLLDHDLATALRRAGVPAPSRRRADGRARRPSSGRRPVKFAT